MDILKNLRSLVNPTLPNFLIIGAAKSATTSLYHYLQQHPEVFLSSIKEPNYFAFAGKKPKAKGCGDPKELQEFLHNHTITQKYRYNRLFKNAGDAKAIGEASVRYLYFPKAALRIHQQIPKVKMVAILRNPIDRAYSHYKMTVQHGFEPLSFTEAVAAEGERIEKGWSWDYHYIQIGMYGKQLSNYYQYFSKDQIKVFLYDDFVSHSKEILQEICQFLSVDDQFPFDTEKRYKEAQSSQHSALAKEVSPETRQQILPLFEEDLRLLESMIDYPLDRWFDRK